MAPFNIVSSTTVPATTRAASLLSNYGSGAPASMADTAMRRLREFINRSAAQHLRARRASWEVR